MKKRLIIEIVILIIVIICCVLYGQSFNLKKQIADYYYRQAYVYLNKLDNEKSTENLLKAIRWDPYLNSQQFQDFKNYRRELLEDPENYRYFFNQNE